MVKNPPYNAGEVGSIPGLATKIPRAMGQLGLNTVPRSPRNPELA